MDDRLIEGNLEFDNRRRSVLVEAEDFVGDVLGIGKLPAQNLQDGFLAMNPLEGGS